MSVPASWRARLSPPAIGQLFVERDEEEKWYGGVIIVPDSYRGRKKSLVGTVREVWVSQYAPGDRVLLDSAITRRVQFDDGVTWYLCRDAQILGWIEGEVEVEEMGRPRGMGKGEMVERMTHALEGKAEDGVVKGGPR